jgi:DAK2 domain fusion protein YloV
MDRVEAVSGPVGHQVATSWEIFDSWLRRATALVGESAEALNAMNVYPIPDSDTGTNLRLTLDGIASAVPGITPDDLDTMVQAAILSAHGNSGAIVAEMLTSVARRLPDQAEAAPAGGRLARLLRVAAVAARRAVARPVEGTIISVAEAAADAAEAARSDHPDDPLAVAVAAQRAAREALARTPDQLEVLAAAGVVDAGGQAYVLLLDALVETLAGEPAEPLTAGPPAIVVTRPTGNGRPPVEYEVMYALRGAPEAGREALRERLSALGHSVVLVGDQSVAQVHVHLREAGAAIEAALGEGRLSQIRITALPPEPPAQTTERTVLCVVAGSGLADAVSALGGTPVLAVDHDRTLAELTAAAEHGSGGDLIILPNDSGILGRAGQLASALRGPDRRATVIPTVAQVQGLAAMAVHEPAADFESVVVAMSNAAGHVRHGAVTVAESAAMTMAGRCRPGDVLGVVMGDFVEIGRTVPEVAWAVIERLLSAGGELLSVVVGAEVDGEVPEQLAERVRTTWPGVDVEVVFGGQPRYPLLLGLE